MNNFKKLLEPSYIGKIKTKNRIIKVGAGTSFVEKGGYIGEAIKDFYAALARGGTGLIIVESCGVDFPSGVHHIPVQLHLEDDKYIQGYSELSAAIHEYQCPALLQLMHSGPWHPAQKTGIVPVASSALSPAEMEELGVENLRSLTTIEIEEMVDKFALAAVRAQKAGFDGVEVNANSTHLINTFLSPIWNKREDIYGYADLESRSRFLVEIIKEIRKRAGPDFAISVLLTGAEYGLGKGISIDEAAEFSKISQDAGADAVQVRAFGYKQTSFLHPGPERMLYPKSPGNLPRELDWSHHGAGAFVPLAGKVKRRVTIPVITVGRLDPILGEKVLENGQADFIGLNRRLLADPDLPNKIAEGRSEDIAPCTACYYCWNERVNERNIKCRINPALGKEREYAIKPAKGKKRVLVVGGGPAGMEAARVAALRGHQVYLYEKEPKLGGLLPIAGLIKGFEIEDMMSIVDYLSRQITKLGVSIRLGTEVNPLVIEKLKPETVVLATGGIATLPDIPGINHRMVIRNSRLHHQLRAYLRVFSPGMLRKLTQIWMPMGKKCVIVGGGIHGCQLAEFLVTRKRKVTIVEETDAIGEGLIPSDSKKYLISWLKESGVVIFSGVKCSEITERGLHIATKDGEEKILRADNIIPALPLQPNHQLFEKIKNQVPEVFEAGDCRKPQLSAEAIADGAYAGRRI